MECAFKAVIARQTQQHEFPDKQRTLDSYVHDPQKLIKAAGLDKAITLDGGNDPDLRGFWRIAQEWSEQSRYKIYTQDEARELLSALEDFDHGVLQWIKRYW